MDADAIVIGAGAAGLSAARNLSRRRRAVIVLEARGRAGGRIWPHPKIGKAVSAELGAEFIHGHAEMTMALLKEAGASAIPTASGDSWTCDADGKLRRERNDFMAAAAIFRESSALADDETVAQFLRRCTVSGAPSETVQWARAFVEGFDAADPERASLRSIAEEWESGVDSTSARPRGGYAPILQLLQDACVAAGAQFRFCTIVQRIEWQRGFVSVHCIDRNGDKQSFRARTAIVTVPAGILRHGCDRGGISFEPVLAAEKREALRYIEMGPVVKVALWFRTPFWERIDGARYRNGAFFYCENGMFPTFWTQLPVRSDLVIAWSGGPRAAKLIAIPNEELIESGRDSFGDLFGDRKLAREEFEDGLMHDWSGDRFALGAYSYVLVGGSGARAALSAPLEETLFFAGEATSTGGQGGTVNGALETGKRAAAEVANALERRSRA